MKSEIIRRHYGSVKTGMVFPLVLLGILSVGFFVIFVHSMSRGYSSQIAHVEKHLKLEAIGRSAYSHILARISEKPFKNRFFFPKPYLEYKIALLGGDYDAYVTDAPNRPYQVDIYIRARYYNAQKLFFWRILVDSTILNAAGKLFSIVTTTDDPTKMPAVPGGSPLSDKVETILETRKTNRSTAMEKTAALKMSSSLKDDIKILDGPPPDDVSEFIDPAPIPPPPPPVADIPQPPPIPLTKVREETFTDLPVGAYPSGWVNMFSGISGQVAEAFSGRKVFEMRGETMFSRVDTIPVKPGERFAYEGQIYLTENNHGGVFGFMYSLDNCYMKYFNSFRFTNDREITFKGKDERSYGTWNANKWYTIRAEFDFSENTAKIYLNGNMLEDKFPIEPPSFYSSEVNRNVTLNRFGFGTLNTRDGQPNKVYIDKVKLFQ